MKLVTGNDLVSGDVIWWTGSGWSRFIADAVDSGTEGEAIGKREEAALRVNGPYVVEAADGPFAPVPLHIKERIRASGPTVRTDLGVQAEKQH
ncbi:DUF2849 domain-containing protein [Sphingomonas sp. BIUV-7]|uniref:DUF2849 domain-containing protein n=1 Tax=Sphingomonas natans TaxID=3063330 RepID=A0ABT8Y939_9SPHN|nr:DUF2849 domain-containing protein [Sphingomonas sp. BIUV-7]MDO6414848.1 DUF2849 domain-containing protein [Sphingomonas sp. BIUV-7]